LTPAEELLFNDYQAELRAHRVIDYDDILLYTRQLFEQEEDTLRDIQHRWDHILVDEFQDLDPVQYEIIKSLAACHGSLFAVGDDEQSIFSWRGADPRMIAYFMRDFGIRVPIILDVNCRSSKQIIETARRILPATDLYPRREIIAPRESPFEVETSGHSDEADEAQWLVQHLVADLTTSGLDPSEYAILYRTHDAGQRLEQALLAAGLACQLGKGRALSDDPVVAQLISSLRLVLEPDSELELERLARHVLPEGLITELAAVPGTSFRAKLRDRANTKAGEDARNCWRLLYQLENLRSFLRAHGELPSLVDAILSQGIGAYVSPLDDLADRLADPAAMPGARKLADRLLDTTALGGQVLLPTQGGLEILFRYMLRKVIPSLAVGYLVAGTSPTSKDFVLFEPDQRDSLVDQQTVTVGGIAPPTTKVLFSALQLIESRHFRKVFTEYVVFDTETTDKDVEECQVVELAAVRVRDGQIVDQFQTLVQCTRPISSGAAAVHGYADADLVGQPSLAEVWPSFRAFIGNAVLVAHNGHRFDVPVLRRLTSPWDGLAGVVFFDSLPLARCLFPTGGLRLEDLAIRFEVNAGRSHHALDDAVCLARVFERLQDERMRRSRVTSLTNLLDALAMAMAIEHSPQQDEVAEIVFRKGARRALGRFSEVLDHYAQEGAAHDIVCPPVAEVIDRLGGRELLEACRRETSPADRLPETYNRLRQILVLAVGETLEEQVRSFLDRTALSRSDGPGLDAGRICLLTFHATKGLEFSRVYVTGVEDFQLPGYYAMTENRETEIQEARRLLYVAMTRAKDRLHLTYCHERNGKPSGGTLLLSEMGLLPPKDGENRPALHQAAQ
jgi:DNA polymerase III epsilon subunit family exonuclease